MLVNQRRRRRRDMQGQNLAGNAQPDFTQIRCRTATKEHCKTQSQTNRDRLFALRVAQNMP